MQGLTEISSSQQDGSGSKEQMGQVQHPVVSSPVLLISTIPGSLSAQVVEHKEGRILTPHHICPGHGVWKINLSCVKLLRI